MAGGERSGGVRRYLFFSHDGFGLGHLRRNWLIASALLRRDPMAAVTIVTGVPRLPPWVDTRAEVVQVPPLLKDSAGAYRPAGMSFDAAVSRRGAAFADLVQRRAPAVVVVDRHPYGTAGELRPGLEQARSLGARLVLGLRDVLDERSVVAEELAGRGWRDVPEVYDEALVYGARHLCDHEAEYGLPIAPRYCGWVTERVPPVPPAPRVLAVAAGGGGDGEGVFRLGVGLLERRDDWLGIVAAGPYADMGVLAALARRSAARRRLRVVTDASGCGRLFAEASAAVQMAGYNTTFEALAAGRRPILVPRRRPRREQAIRGARLAALGLADVVDEQAPAGEVDWLLDQPRHLAPEHLDRAGIVLDGAERASDRLEELGRPLARR